MKDVCNAHSSYFTKENMFLSNKAGMRYSGAAIHMRMIFFKTPTLVVNAEVDLTGRAQSP